MSEVNCIKTLRNEKGLSITEIANTMQVNWRTAKKYGDGDQLPQEKTHLKKGMMYDEKWGEIVVDWLEEDLKLKKKLRRTNKKLLEELVKMGFKGSYRTLCNFIQEWKSSQEDETDKGHERLDHPEGEAQLDFGVMEAVQNGEIIDVHALVMSFPSSNTAFAVPMPGENLECFLGGLQMLFKQANGVPLSIRIDNLSPAVKKVRKGDSEAQLTEAFRHFQQYYGFKVQVCNPRKGNEKGHVETVFVDLTTAVGVGILLSMIIFVKGMSDLHVVSKVLPDPTDKRQRVSPHILTEVHDCPQINICTIEGPLFFGSAQMFEKTLREVVHPQAKILILRLGKVPYIDTTGESNLSNIVYSLFS